MNKNDMENMHQDQHDSMKMSLGLGDCGKSYTDVALENVASELSRLNNNIEKVFSVFAPAQQGGPVTAPTPVDTPQRKKHTRYSPVELDAKIVELLTAADGKPLRSRELCKACDVSLMTLYGALKRLRTNDVVFKMGETKRDAAYVLVARKA